MSGKRQHYIPQLLQRGFLATVSDDAERTWLHRRNAEPRLVSIRDIGVEEYFYSRPTSDGSPTLDQFITGLESGFLSEEVQGMRRLRAGDAVDAHLAAKVVVHLVTRTNQVRAILTQAMETLSNTAALHFADAETFRDLLGFDHPMPSPLLSETLRQTLDALPLHQHGIPRQLAERILMFMAREQLPELVARNAKSLRPAFGDYIKRMSSQVRDSHNASLELPDARNRSVQRLSEFDWRIEVTEVAILSDGVALAVEDGSGYVPYTLARHAAVNALVMPLTTDRLLVGRRDLTVDVDLERYNEAAAACSGSFFVCAGPRERALRESIGTRSYEAIRTLSDQAIQRFRAQTLPEEHEAQMVGASEEIEAGPSSFALNMTFIGVESEAVAYQIGSVTKATIQEMARHLPLYNLDGLTFAANFVEALAKLDRGCVSLSPTKPTSLDHAKGVAMAVEVVRESKPKKHIVVDLGFAADLISGDSTAQQTVLGVLVKMLASVAHATLYKGSLGNAALPPDAVSRLIHSAASSAPELYFTARESAFVAPDMGQIYAQLVVDGFAHARDVVTKERLRYRVTYDLDGLLRVSLTCVKAILEQAANWLGHRDGVPEGAKFKGDDLPDRPGLQDLKAWLELFGRDLRAIYGSSSRQLDHRRLYALDSHVERLLWMFQILPWTTDDGAAFVSVPYGDDIRRLGRSLA